MPCFKHRQHYFVKIHSDSNKKKSEMCPISRRLDSYETDLRVRVRIFNTTFNNILVTISWRSVLLVKETGVPGKNHRPAT